MSFGLNHDPQGLRILLLLFFFIPVAVIISFLLPMFVTVLALNYVLLYLTVLFLLVYIQHHDEKRPRAAKSPYSLAILVPCFNSKGTISKCIQSIKAMEYPKKFRIIVADDGSTDGTREILKGIIGIELLELPHRGKGFAMNDALQKITEDAIVSIDSDTYPAPDTLKKIVGHLDDPKVGAINALLIPDKRETFIQKVQYLEYVIAFGYWNTVLSSLNMMSYVTGPLTVFRRSAMLKAGYFFDTKNLAEDMEIGLRLQKFGYKIKVCASARVETDVPRTVDRLVKQRDRWYRSRVYNLIKYRSLFFNRANPELGFFGLPYLFMVEILIIVLLIRLVIILASNAMEYLQLGSLLVFSARVFPQVNLDLSVETQLYFFVVTTFVVALAYYLGLGLAKYKLKRSDILPLIFQFTIYPYFIAFVYLRGIVRELLGAKPVWERVSF